MPDFVKIQAQAQLANNQASRMKIAVDTYLTTKIADIDLTTAQKTALRTQFTNALAIVKDAIAVIDTELAN